MENVEKKQLSFPGIVVEELSVARKIYPPFNSLHEAYAVILEEMKEFEVEVFRKPADRNNDKILHELAQLAAMCQRAVEDCLLAESNEKINV